MADELKQFTETFEKSLKPGALKSSDERGNCIWLTVRQSDLLQACQVCMANDSVFDSAFISSRGNEPASSFIVYYLFRSAALGKMVVVQSQGKEFDAISADVNAARWDERKMQDLTGLKFTNIPDSRPLIFHPESEMPDKHPIGGKQLIKPKNQDYPIAGTGMEGEFQIAVGPVHAGIIEPGHFRFHVLGEQINKLETRMFYLHRGIEKSLEGKNLVESLPMIEQISGDESVANSVAFCHAAERAFSLTVPKRAEFIRAILLELERIYSHLADLGGMPTDVGFYFAASRFAVLREDMMRLNQQVSGNRFLRGICAVGGVTSDIDKSKTFIITKTLDEFLKRFEAIEHTTLTSSTYLDRVFSTGKVPKSAAEDLALVGPVARACGISCDLRKSLPYSVYSDLSINESMEANGDVLSRFLVKASEVKESVRLVKWLVHNLPSGTLSCPVKLPSDEEAVHFGVGWAEAPRGGCTFFIELSDSGKIDRLACKTPSFRNWRGIETCTDGNIVPDFPLINKSFNMSYAGTDL
ncbi:MAG: NADH-quinone oxidoreductase subunit C [Candidatus Micrarchaeota archaeon]|nr:NADH-quinone oxidoreductase subunit C [Candidatus Micrarchaeota archaeon]